MATIYVSGLPFGLTEERKKTIREELKFQAIKVEGLKLKMEQILVWFPPNHIEEGLGEEFSILVLGVRTNDNMDHILRKLLSSKLALALRSFFPGAKIVDVYVPSMDHWGCCIDIG
jgi:hypothetical protein